MEYQTESSIISNLLCSLGSAESSGDFLNTTLVFYQAQMSWFWKVNEGLRQENEFLKEKVSILEKANIDFKEDGDEKNMVIFALVHKMSTMEDLISNMVDEKVDELSEMYQREIIELKTQVRRITQQKDQFKKICGGLSGVSRFFLKQNHTSIDETICSENISTKACEECKCQVSTKSSDKSYQKLLSEIEDLLVCPISFQRIRTPVMLPSGKTIDESTFDKLAGAKKCDPFTRNPLKNRKLVNRFAMNLIEIVERSKKSSAG